MPASTGWLRLSISVLFYIICSGWKGNTLFPQLTKRNYSLLSFWGQSGFSAFSAAFSIRPIYCSSKTKGVREFSTRQSISSGVQSPRTRIGFEIPLSRSSAPSSTTGPRPRTSPSSPTSPKASDGYVQIGDGVVIAKRHTLPNSGDVDLRQFIPFYLGPRSPMLYVIQKGYNRVTCFHPSELGYCIVRLSDIFEQDIECMFTDGHAFSAITRYYTREYLGKIDDYVKREDVYAQFWNVEDDIDLKRRKEAELLIKTELPAKYIKGFVVYNNEARVQLLEYGVAASKIVIRESYYF